MMQDQIKLPSSREAENHVVGCVIIDSTLADQVLNQVTSKDFFYADNRAIMTALEGMFRDKRLIDATTLVNELKRLGLLEAAGGTEHIFEIVGAIPSVANVDAYVKIIQETSVQRKLFNTLEEIKSDILSGKYSHHDLMNNSETKFIDIIENQTEDSFKRIDLLTDNVISIIEKNKNTGGQLVGIDTGFAGLNNLINGFKQSEFIILAARPGVGKSAFALNCAAAACKAKKNVALFSLEMGHDQILMRMFSSFSGVDLTNITTGTVSDDEMTLLYQSKQNLDKLGLYIDQSATSDVRDIRAKCQKLYREGKLDLVIIDYLQLVKSGENTGNRVNEVGAISRQLKQMALQLHIPVLALSQLSRDIEKREDKRPVLADLRESGSIEQDADIVMFLYREDPKKDGEADTTRKVQSARTELIVAKNRQGMTGSVNLIFKGKNSEFTPYDGK